MLDGVTFPDRSAEARPLGAPRTWRRRCGSCPGPRRPRARVRSCSRTAATSGTLAGSGRPGRSRSTASAVAGGRPAAAGHRARRAGRGRDPGLRRCRRTARRRALAHPPLPRREATAWAPAGLRGRLGAGPAGRARPASRRRAHDAAGPATSRSTTRGASSTPRSRPAGARPLARARPTTTGSAAWPSAGRRWGLADSAPDASTRSSGRRCRHRPRDVDDRRRDRGPPRRQRIAARRPPAGIRVEETVEIPDALADLPRVGTVLDAPGRARGRGLVRARARTRRTRTGSAAAASGAGASTVAEQLVPYVRPQESGGHADVRWLELRDAAGAGVRIDLDQPRQVSVLHQRGRGPRRAPTHVTELRPRAETIVTLDAAHRGVGTASCGPDTLAAVPRPAGHAPLDVDRWSRWRRPLDDHRLGRRDARVAPPQRVTPAGCCAVLENGWLGHLHAGAPLAPGRRYRHLALPFHGLRQPRRRARSALALPGPGVGDFRVPGARGRDRRRRDRARPAATPATAILAGKPALDGGLPSTYVEDDDEAETLEIDLVDAPSGRPVTLSTRSSRDLPVVARSMRDPNAGATAVDGAHRHERLAGPARRRLDAGPAVRHLGARAVTSSSGRWSRAASRSAACAAAPAREHNPFLALRRAATTEDDRRSLGRQPRLLGQLPRRGRGRPVRDGPAPDRHPPRGVRLAPRARARRSRRPEAVLAWTDRRARRRVSDAFHRLFRDAARARPVARRGPRRSCSTTGRAPTSTSTTTGWSPWPARRRRPGRRAVRARRRLVRRAATTTTASLGDWFVDRRKLPDGLDGAGRRRSAALGIGSGSGSSPRWSTPDSDLFRAHPDWAIGVPGRPRTESRKQLVLDLGQPEVVDHLADAIGDVLASAPIDYVKWDLNRYMTEPWTPAAAGRAPGRVLPPVRPRPLRALRAADDALPATSCSSPAPAAAAGSTPGCSRLRRRPGPATTPTRSSGCAIQWGTSLAYPLSLHGRPRVGGAEPPGRADHADRVTRAAVAFFGAFGYELDPTALTDDERAEVRAPDRVLRRAAGAVPARAVRAAAQPVRGRRQRDGLDGRSTTDAHARSSASTGCSHRPLPARDRLPLRGLDPAARYEVTVWSVVRRRRRDRSSAAATS